MLGDALRARLNDLGLKVVSGSMLAASDAEIEFVSELHTVLFSQVAVDDLPIVVEQLAKMGYLVAIPNTQWCKVGIGAIREGCGTLAVASDSALYLPARLTEKERNAAVTHFIACQPADSAKLMNRFRKGSWTIVAVTPTVELTSFLEEANPPESAAIACRETRSSYGYSYAWHVEASDRLVGPFRPARSLASFIQQTVPAVWTAVCEVTPSASSIDMPERTYGGATCLHRADAEVRALAEAYERHTAGRVVREDVVVSSLVDLGPDAVHPDTIVAYREWQLQMHPSLVRFDSAQPRLWVKMVNLEDRIRWMLADLVFYPFGKAGTQLHSHANSSGMAAHVTAESAVKNAWAELLERDAFMRRWLSRQSPPQVLIDLPLVEGEAYLQDLTKRGWTVALLALGQSLEPIVGALAYRANQLSFGAAAADNPRIAAEKALREAWSIVVNEGDDAAPVAAEVRSPADHRRLYLYGDNADSASFLWAASQAYCLASLIALLFDQALRPSYIAGHCELVGLTMSCAWLIHVCCPSPLGTVGSHSAGLMLLNFFEIAGGLWTTYSSLIRSHDSEFRRLRVGMVSRIPNRLNVSMPHHR